MNFTIEAKDTKNKQIVKMTAKSKQERKEELADKFISLSPDVNELDKASAIIRLETNMSTINRYLKGQVGILEFGEKLYKLLKGLVDKRNTTAQRA